MAKDLYKGRQMYQGPWLFYILIPIGAVALMFLVDWGYKIYNEYILNRDTKAILYKMLEAEDLTTQEEYKELAKKELEELGYEENKDVTVILRDDYIILINYKNYYSVIGELITKTKKVAVARFKGYTNEYKEAVVEEYTIEEEDELYEEEESASTEPVGIPAKR